MNDLLIAEIQYILDRDLFQRPRELDACKTDEAKERLKDRWVIEDAAEKIAHALQFVRRDKIFGIF